MLTLKAHDHLHSHSSLNTVLALLTCICPLPLIKKLTDTEAHTLLLVKKKKTKMGDVA